MIRAALKGAFRAGGYSVRKLPVDNLEENLRSLFDDLDIRCVIDVGAHFGEFGKLLRTIGYANRIVSFEPVADSYRILETAAAQDPAWFTHNVALGRRDEVAEIKVSKNSVFTSFLEASDYSLAQFGAHSALERTEQVTIVTLDSVFAQCVADLRHPAVYLKLDTQGFDIEVVAGATNSLRSIAGIQSEVSVKKIYQGMPDWMEAMAVYKSLGFEPTGLYPVTRDQDAFVIEFDCVMRRRPEAAGSRRAPG